MAINPKDTIIATANFWILYYVIKYLKTETISIKRNISIKIGLFVGFLASKEDLMNLLQLNTLPETPVLNYSQDSYIENKQNKEVETFTQRIEDIKLNYNNFLFK